MWPAVQVPIREWQPYRQALTHPTALAERPDRLRWQNRHAVQQGGSIIGTILREVLLERLPLAMPGELTQVFKVLRQDRVLFQIALAMELDKLLVMHVQVHTVLSVCSCACALCACPFAAPARLLRYHGSVDCAQGMRSSKHVSVRVLSSALRAVVFAICNEHGYPTARDWFARRLFTVVDLTDLSAFQPWPLLLQSFGHGPAQLRLLDPRWYPLSHSPFQISTVIVSATVKHEQKVRLLRLLCSQSGSLALFDCTAACLADHQLVPLSYQWHGAPRDLMTHKDPQLELTELAEISCLWRNMKGTSELSESP